MRKQVGMLTGWSFLIVAPFLLTVGTNIVTHTYREAAQRFWSGASLYANSTQGDVFLYSPFFAAAYGVFAYLPSKLQALAWAFLNALVFWAGVSTWFSFRRDTAKWLWLALAVCSMELDGSLRYQQVNALMTGLTLLGLAAYRSCELEKSGFWMALGTNVKLIPGFFSVLLAWPVRRRWWPWFIGISLALVILTGAHKHFEWFHRLVHNIEDRKLLDIATVMGRLGFETFGRILWWGIACLSAVFLGGARLVCKEEVFPWHSWISVGLCALILLSPKTESPTFVFLAPAYLLLATSERTATRVLLLVAMFTISISYNSVWPHFLRLPLQQDFTTKTLGALVLWGVALYELALTTARTSHFAQFVRLPDP